MKPCPFCGSDKNLSVREGITPRWIAVECGGCGAIGPDIRIQVVGDGTFKEWFEIATANADAAWDARTHEA